METIKIPSIMLEISAFELVQLREKMIGLVILDVRQAREVRRGCIPGAYHIPLACLLDYMHRPPIQATDRPIVVYCHSGKRSLAACQLLSEEGYQRLYNLSGGIEAYRQANLPLRRPTEKHAEDS